MPISERTPVWSIAQRRDQHPQRQPQDIQDRPAAPWRLQRSHDAGTFSLSPRRSRRSQFATINQNCNRAAPPRLRLQRADCRQRKRELGLRLRAADFGAFNLNGGRGATNVPYPSAPADAYTVRATMDTDWLLTARARLGWVLQPDVLIYATRGLALTNLLVSNSFTVDGDSAGVGGGSHAQIMTGWTLGGGAEVALSRAWSIKAEYLYVDFGSTTVRSSVACGPAATFNCNFDPCNTERILHVRRSLRAHRSPGLNYKF